MTAHRWVRQGPWALAVVDQGLSSIGNLALTIAVARATSQRQLGALAIALLLYALVLGVSRSLCTEPFTVLAGGRPEAHDRALTGQLLGAVLAVGSAAGLLLAGTAGVLRALGSDPVTAALIALAVLLPLLLLVDACRYLAFARGEAQAAVLVDGVWTVGVVLVLWFLSERGTANAAPFLWLWGAAAVPALLAGVLRLHLRIGRGTRAWLERSRHLGRPITGQFLAETGTMQVANLLIAAAAGLGGAASVRVAATVFAPVSVVLAGLSNLLLPRLSTRALSGAASRNLVGKATSLAVATAVVYLALVQLLPDDVGTALFGPSWSPSTPLLVGYGVFIACSALMVAPARALLGAGFAKVGLTVALRQLPVVLLAPVVGYLLAGTAGIGWGFALAGALSALLWAQQYARHARAKEGTT